MSIKDYALELGVSSEIILKKLKELGHKYNNENDYLDDEDIIILDNELGDLSNNNLTEELADKFEMEDRAEEAALAYNIKLDNQVKVKEKIKKKESSNKNQSQEDLNKKKKNIYKNKTKLQSNKEETASNVVIYKEGMSVSDLADELGISASEIVKKLIGMGLMISSSQAISFDDASVVVLEYNKELVKEETTDISNFEEYVVTDKEEDLEPRPAVVTIMGHVDHGKTTLLDYIRNSHVASSEAGGITQAIGAYQVEINGRKITFIDTPGHEAFTEMRARGASITDIVIIVVSAEDGIMPQTKEAIDHAKAANVPIIVAVNKMDLPNANPERVLQELTEYGLTPEEWGGDTLVNRISAKTKAGINELLENVLLVADLKDLKANKKRYATGSVLEARVDKNVGSVCTLLINNGTLRLGDPIVVGTCYGKVRTLKNDQGKNILTAEPSTPVEITGLNDVPTAGDLFMAFETEKEARHIAEKRLLRSKEANTNRTGMTLDDLFNKVQEGAKKLSVVLKTDVKGSEEAIKAALQKINIEGVKVDVIRSSVGTITESDIVLANASNAIIIGFNVRPSSKTLDVAKEYNVDVRLHNVIYKIIEEIEQAIKGLLDPIYEEKILGTAEIRQLFKFSKVGMIAGILVTDGVIKLKDKARVIRDGIVVHDGVIASIQRGKDKANEVKKGIECGITFDNFSDFKEQDIIEAYTMEEIKR